MHESQALTRLQIVETILTEINMTELRPLIRTEKVWRRLCTGFRPDRISKRMLLARKLEIARRKQMVLELLEIFIKSLGIDTGSLEQALDEASTDSRLTNECRHLLARLKDVDINGLETGSSQKSIETPLTYTKPEAPSTKKTLRRQTNDTSMTRDEFIWQPPMDESKEAQHVVTLFERSLVAFVTWRLQKYHNNERWIHQACGQFLKTWQNRARGSALEPATLLGFAELGEIKDIIISNINWPTFEPYFPNKPFIENAMGEIISLRHSGMHAGERDIYFTEHLTAINAMVRVVSEYDTPTATAIDEVFRQLTGSADSDLSGWSSDQELRIQTNLPQLSETHIVGRKSEMKSVRGFWDDPYQRILSIVGSGGVGKTALLDETVRGLLLADQSVNSRPDPEAIIYLTAKDNYLEGMPTAPTAIRFTTLHEIYTVTAETVSGDDYATSSMRDLRDTVLGLAQEVRILFALDNLESLSDDDMDEVGQFLDELPRPSKAIITTRDNRRYGKAIRLTGLPRDDSYEMLLQILAEAGITLAQDELPILDEIINTTSGVPLYLKHAASNITQAGYSAKEALNRLRGKPILDLLEFSYANCFDTLPEGAIRIAYFLAISNRSRKRNELRRVCQEADELDAALRRLDELAFIERDNASRPTAFKLVSPQIEEFATVKVRDYLRPDIIRLIRNQRGGISLTSPRNVEIAVDNLIDEVYKKPDWRDRIAGFERLRSDWNDHPKILAALGYCYYRDHQRRKARPLIQTAIERGEDEYGLESAQWYATLALIHFLDGEIDESIGRAETAIALRPRFHRAEQILGQALFEKAKRGRLTMSSDRVIEIVKQAKSLLVRSLYEDDTRRAKADHNDRSHRILGRIEAFLSGRNHASYSAY